MFDEIAGGSGEPERKEEVEEWRTLISDLTSQLQEAKAKIENLEAKGQPGLTPEMEALQDQVASISTELQEARAALQTAQQELAQMRQSKSAAEDNPTRETPKEGLSDQTAQPDQKPPVAQTKASRIGWLR